MVEQHEKTLVPQIRFAGFTDPWEQRKLGELFEESDERASDREILSVSVANGIYPASESDRETNPGASLANYKIVHFGDVVYNSMRMWQGAVDASRYDGIVSPAYVVARPNSEVYARFFARLLRQPMLLKQYQQVSQGNSKDTQVLKFDDFASIGISMPASENEQRRIGGFFDRLDSLITLHQRKYDKLTNVKKSMLEKMFPQNGSNAPEIRFKGFTEAWEQRKLGDVVDVRSGKDYKHLSEGNIPVYGTGGFMLSVNQALSYDEDAIGIGRKGTIDKPYILKAPFWTVDTLFYAIPREKVDLNFAFDVFQNIDWKKKDESTGVPSLSKTAINEIDVLVPQYDEQQPLGQFFNRIDNLITLHQRKPNFYTGGYYAE